MHKTKMYACFAFFPDGSVKRWKYVTSLTGFMLFLSKSHPAWKYFNVYEKGSKQFLKRFYPGNTVPAILGMLMLVFLLTQKFTFGNNLSAQTQNPITLKNTFNKATFNKTTFINGFNNSSTIPTLLNEKGGTEC